MAFIILDENVVFEFVPEYKGNNKTKEPLTLELTPVNNKGVNNYGKRLSDRAENCENNTEYMKVSDQVQREQFCKHVRSIKNCKIRTGEGETAITDASVFYDKAPKNLVTEILRKMENAAELTGDQEKNSEGDSAGTS